MFAVVVGIGRTAEMTVTIGARVGTGINLEKNGSQNENEDAKEKGKGDNGGYDSIIPASNEPQHTETRSNSPTPVLTTSEGGNGSSSPPPSLPHPTNTTHTYNFPTPTQTTSGGGKGWSRPHPSGSLYTRTGFNFPTSNFTTSDVGKSSGDDGASSDGVSKTLDGDGKPSYSSATHSSTTDKGGHDHTTTAIVPSPPLDSTGDTGSLTPPISHTHLTTSPSLTTRNDGDTGSPTSPTISKACVELIVLGSA